jgi:uncharacterized protein YqjF (DUF2071 family)
MEADAGWSPGGNLSARSRAGGVDGAMKTAPTPPTLQQRLAERSRPPGPVVMYQRWEQLLFLHWRHDPAVVQASLPPGLTVDTFKGAAWLGLVPLFMRDVRPRFVPPVPGISDFLELNARTYVFDADGRPGLYFFSLDCDQPLAVESARRLLHLRYEHCAMQAAVADDGRVDFRARGAGSGEESRFRYRASGSGRQIADEESLEFFLIERYRLFASDADGEQRSSVRVCHAPYRLRSVELAEWSDAMLRWAGFDPGARPPEHVCAAEPVEVEVFAPERVG